MEIKGEDMLVFTPNRRMFEFTPGTVMEQSAKRDAQTVPIFKFLGASKTEGWRIHYFGNLYPEKGMKNPEGAYAVHTVKKISLGLIAGLANKGIILPAIGLMFTPWKWKINMANSFLEGFVDAADILLERYYPLKVFYSPMARGIRQLVYLFLKNLGFSRKVYSTVSKIIVMFFTYDDAYKYRIQDIFTTTTKEKLMANPRKAITDMFKVYIDRERSARGKDLDPKLKLSDWKRGYGVYGKFRHIEKILNVILLLPRIKKAFIDAVRNTDIKKIYLDDGDIYHCLTRGAYDYMGVPLDMRKQTYLKLHNGHIPPWLEIYYEE